MLPPSLAARGERAEEACSIGGSVGGGGGPTRRPCSTLAQTEAVADHVAEHGKGIPRLIEIHTDGTAPRPGRRRRPFVRAGEQVMVVPLPDISWSARPVAMGRQRVVLNGIYRHLAEHMTMNSLIFPS